MFLNEEENEKYSLTHVVVVENGMVGESEVVGEEKQVFYFT